MTDLILSPTDNPLYKCTPHGIVLADNLSYKDWYAVGQVLQYLALHIQFAVGDWIVYGNKKYGEMYAQAISATGKAYGTLANYAWVAGRIEPSRRRVNVRFGQHSEVAKYTPELQDHFLDMAEAHDMSVMEVRQMVAEYNNRDNHKPTTVSTAAGRLCPNCGYEYRYED